MKQYFFSIALVAGVLLVGAGCSSENANSNINTQTDSANTAATDAAEEVTPSRYSSEYGYQFSYDNEWVVDTGREAEPVGTISTLNTVVASIQGEQSSSMDVTFSVLNSSLDEIVESIESSDRLDSGESLAAVSAIENRTIGGLDVQTGVHQTAIGIPVRFYYIALSNDTALFVSGYEYDDARTEKYTELLGSVIIE